MTFHAWDHDESGSSESLGQTKLYLHHITGSVRDDRPVMVKPLTRIKIHRRRAPLHPLLKAVSGGQIEEVEVRTRVFKGVLNLKHNDPAVKATLQIEVRRAACGRHRCPAPGRTCRGASSFPASCSVRGR